MVKEEKSLSAISLDMDGTLLNSAGQVSAENIAAIQRINQAKIPIVLASGRPINSLTRIGQEWLQVPIYRIGNNGATIANQQNQIIGQSLIDEAVVMAVAEIAEHYAVNVNFSTMNKWIHFTHQTTSAAIDEYNETLDEYQVHTVTQFAKLNADIKNPVMKFGMKILDDVKFEQVRKALQNLPLTVVESDAHFLEAMAIGTSKYTALKRLAAIQGWSIDRVLAFGDYENDIELLDNVGFSVAMGNALATVKQTADYVTVDNDQHGVAKVLNYYSQHRNFPWL